MGRIGKPFALFLTLVIVISCLTLLSVKPVSAQSPHAPSVPSFTVKFVPANYPESTNITIKNQPFVPSDNLTSFNYNVRYKAHSQENWTEVFTESTAENRLLAQNTTSENTSISLYQTTDQTDLKGGFGFIDIQGYSQVDFQAEAVIATFHPFAPHGDTGTWTYITSDWSSTQTVTIPASSVSPSPTPNVPEFPTLVIPPLFTVVTLLSVVAIRKIPTSRKEKTMS
jgi:hypothetical protein